MFVSGTGGLWFKFWAGNWDPVLPTVHHCCDHSSKEAAVLPRHNDMEIVCKLVTLGSNTSTMIKDLI